MAGRSGTADWDESDDDAFEEIPDETLKELEEDAIRATQQRALASSTTRPPKFVSEPPKFIERTRPVLTTIQNNASQSRRQVVEPGAQEELVNLDDYAQGGTSYYGPSQTPQSTSAGHTSNRGNQWRYGQQKPMPYRNSNQAVSGPRQIPTTNPLQTLPQGPDLTSLKATIQRLEREKLALKQAAQESQSREQAKSGEVAILRETLTRSRNEYEQRIDSLRQAQTEAADKSQAEILALHRAKEKIETDKKFLEHDLSIEAGKKITAKTQTLSGTLRTRSVPEASTRGGSTSRKSSFLNVGDGFDEQEISRQSPRKNRSFENGISSPSRRDAVKALTPNQRPEKRRKRDASPTLKAELSFHDPADSPDFTPLTPDHSFDYEGSVFSEFNSFEKLDFVERVMDHRVFGTNHHLLEELGKYSLPSNPDITFVGLVLDHINSNDINGENNPAMNFCTAICDAWSQCLTERYYEPLNLLVESFNFAISSQRFSFLRKVIDKAALLATQTIELVADPIPPKLTSINDVREIPNVNTEECMKLLITLATACAESQEYTTQFWKIISFRFLSILLSVQQPLPLVSMMCELLTYSCTDTSFGPIYSSNDSLEVSNQDDIDFWIGDRLITFLFDIPIHPETGHEASFSLFQVLPFRLKVLDALASMCMPRQIEQSLAKHISAIARLFEFLYEHVETLYSYDPRIVSSPRLVSLTVASINKAIFVIYQLLRTPIKSEAEDGTEIVTTFDVREKLKAVNGGEFMHTIALTRLVFGEQPDVAFMDLEPQELEIWTHVGDTAHRLLDEFLSPDEGEMLLKMYSTGEQGLGTVAGTGVTGNSEDDKSRDVKMMDEDGDIVDEEMMEEED